MCMVAKLEGGMLNTKDFVGCRVVVREVLSCLVINCDVSVADTQFEAAFTTLADTEVTRLQGELPALLMVRHPL